MLDLCSPTSGLGVCTSCNERLCPIPPYQATHIASVKAGAWWPRPLPQWVPIRQTSAVPVSHPELILPYVSSPSPSRIVADTRTSLGIFAEIRKQK